MLETFRKAFQVKDIRKKIAYTFLMLVVIRIGSQLPTPGVNSGYIKEFFAQNTQHPMNTSGPTTSDPAAETKPSNTRN